MPDSYKLGTVGRTSTDGALVPPTCRCDSQALTGDGLCLKCGKWPPHDSVRVMDHRPRRQRRKRGGG